MDHAQYVDAPAGFALTTVPTPTIWVAGALTRVDTLVATFQIDLFVQANGSAAVTRAACSQATCGSIALGAGSTFAAGTTIVSNAPTAVAGVEFLAAAGAYAVQHALPAGVSISGTGSIGVSALGVVALSTTVQVAGTVFVAGGTLNVVHGLVVHQQSTVLLTVHEIVIEVEVLVYGEVIVVDASRAAHRWR